MVITVLGDVIAMAPELPGDRAATTRSAAMLLLEHTCPWLTHQERVDLAGTCVLAATRHTR